MRAMMQTFKQQWQEALAPLTQRWQQLQAREQMALRLLALIALLLFLLYGVFLPSQKAATTARLRYEDSRNLLLQMQARAASLKGRATANSSASLLSLCSDQASQQKLVLTRIEPEGDQQVRVWLEKADFNTVAAWLSTLAGQGIALQEAQIERQADGAGVTARLVLGR